MTLTPRWLPRPYLTLLLTILWLALMGSFSFGHLILGGLLGWLIPYVTQPFWPEKVTLHNGWHLVKYFLVLLGDILYSNLIVARRIIRSPKLLRPGFIYYPLELDDEFAITILASTISLTPGTVSANISADRKTLLIHALHVDDEAGLIADLKARYEQPLMEIFGC